MKPIIKELMLKARQGVFPDDGRHDHVLFRVDRLGILPAKGVGGGAAGLSLVLCHAVEEWLGVSYSDRYDGYSSSTEYCC